MILGVLNIDNTLKEELSKDFTIDTILDTKVKAEALFVDWIPSQVSKSLDKTKASYLLHQTTLVEEYVKSKLPVLIFDRWFGITQKEFFWFRKNNVKLFEPALNNRREFQYLPFWTRIKKVNDIEIDDNERPYPLAFKGYLMNKIRSFEKYYVDYGKLYPPQARIVYDSSLDKKKQREYENYSVEKVPAVNFREAKCTVIIGSKKDYKIGYLSPTIFEALDNNCVPLIPEESRYFGGLSEVIKTPAQISFFTRTYDFTYIGLLADCYKSIERNYPEFKINHTIDVIKTNLK